MDIIRSRYDEAYCSKIRRLEKREFKLPRSVLDLRFFLDRNKNVFPKFIRFGLSNRQLLYSHVYN